MLYTKKGDDGMTSTFGCDQRLSKSSAIAEALGTLDELNSFLGIVKMHEQAKIFLISTSREHTLVEIVGELQQNLFIVQAELAGADRHIHADKIHSMEIIVEAIEKNLPPIKSFFLSGGTELAALVDFARTLTRRAERRVVDVYEESAVSVPKNTLAYMNRLSSLLYACARWANHIEGIQEEEPLY